MGFGNVILDPAALLPAVAFASLLGLTLWWLVRKRQTRIWLPTIRIMRLESRILPRLVVRPPPLLSFISFLVSAAVLTGFALRPRTQIFTPYEPNQTRIHIFADLSASVAAHVTIEEYVQRLTVLFTSLKKVGRVTVSTSVSPEVSEPESAEALALVITQAGFQRSGLRIGSALKVLLEDLGETDRLFIVSDRDQHSWTGFNWQFLLDDMEVAFLDLSSGKAQKNTFINDARFLSSPNSPTMEWDVELSRQNGDVAAKGTLTVSYMGKALGEFPWKMPVGKQRLDVRAEWPGALIDEAVKASGGVADTDIPLVFRTTVEDQEDALAADNEYRVRLRGVKQDVLLVSESSGERVLEDPMEQLDTAFEILGFKVRRNDYVVQPGPSPEALPFIVLAGGSGSGVDRFCPKSLEDARLRARERQGASEGRKAPSVRIWLMPYTVDADYGELCECYARLMVSKRGDKGKPAFCENVTSRQGWIGLLPSLGAKQIGGDIGEQNSSLAYHARDQASGLEILAFTVPLTPMRGTGLTHAALPVLVKQLATWQGLLEPRGVAGATSWPRVEDWTSKTWRPTLPIESDEQLRLRQTNVPLGESLLAEADQASLPPKWTADAQWQDRELAAKKDREDPLPWLKLAVMIVLGFALLEGIVLLGIRVVRFVGRRSEVSALLPLFIALGLGGGAPKAEAKVEFNLLGYQSGGMTLSTLAREVSNRTSIEVANKPHQFTELTTASMAEPWLWVNDLRTITTEAGRLKPDLALWLKRGGFLVIEVPAPELTLAKLTAGFPTTGSEGWRPLPPDHEIMRSFYLLDALPGCNNEIWRGFQYDGRLAVLAIPYGFLASLRDQGGPAPCQGAPNQEQSVRVFVNLIMVALATDYKKDQIHLPEILKRLR